MPRALSYRAVLILGLLLSPGLVDASAGVGQRSQTHLVRIPDRARAGITALSLKPERTLHYGTFDWLTLSSSDLARLQASGVPYEQQMEPYALRLGEQRFDPLERSPVLPSGWAEVRADGPDLHLVQFVGPTQQTWLDDLDARGLKVVQYVHPYTYIVWGESTVLPGRDRKGAGSANAEVVRWTGPFAPAYRVLPRWRSLSDEPQKANVLLYRGADADAAIYALAGLAGKVGDRVVLNETFEIVDLMLSGPAFQQAARIPGVYSIQPEPTDGGLRGEMSDQVNVNNVDGNNLAFPGYLGWLAGVGLSGGGVIIANVDGGVQDSHPDLINRLIGCSGPTCGGGATSGHGTHTAGIMAADGASGTLDSFGFLRGLGQAPGASLVEQVYSPWFTQPGGMLLLMTDSYNNGASLSGNSWGPAGTPRGYDDDTMQVDIGVRDADPDTPGNQPLTYVLSIMNGGGGTSSQGTPDEAKNIFTIGSTKMQTSGGSQILAINDVSSNSAHGPCLDGRKIPHLVAPGKYVDSSYSGSGYALLFGTSMASPHVSGAVAVFIEYYRSLPDFKNDPSPAMVKAAFLPVAHDLAGYDDADGIPMGHPFDNKQGWGRMDLEAVVDPQLTARYFDNPVVFDNTGEEWVTSLSPEDPSQPMRLMLVWTDAPGHGLGGSSPAWNNDLDLVVEVGGDTYRGNVFGSSGWSVQGGSADLRNNTEGVFLGPTSPAFVTVRVIAGNINSDGIPNQGDATDQDFAFVCYNCANEPGFTLTAEPSEIALCAPDDAVYNIDIGQIMGFTDPVTLSAGGEPPGTNVIFSINPVIPPGSSSMTITNTDGATAGFYTIDIDGTAPTMTQSTSVDLTLYAGVPDAPTLTFPSDGATDVSLRPVFTWSPSTPADQYEFELATDAGFVDIVDSASGLSEPTYGDGPLLDPTTEYFWRVRASNLCGVGADSATFSFATRESATVLLVDDDDNSPDVRSYYTDAFDALGQDYDLWNTNNSDNEPDAATLGEHDVVIWFTGDEWGGAAGPGASGETALASFLDGGGGLFISSQDYYYDRGMTGFMSGYLGVSSASSDVGQTSVTGAGSVFSGMGPYSLSYPFTNYSDRVSPGASAELAFSGNAGDAAVNKDAGAYRTIFWGFPWEAISSVDDRHELLSTVLDYCAGVACAQPAITAQPASVSVCDGGAATFAVSASGTEPLTYQWRLSGADIPGAASDSYTIDPVSPGDAGGYDIVVTGPCGAVTSDAATLTVMNDADCDDGNECTADTCEPATGCQNEYRVLFFGDLVPWFAADPGAPPQPDLDDVICVLDGFGAGIDWASVCPEGDLWDAVANDCGSDGGITIEDIFAILDAFAHVSSCPHPCPS